MKRLAIIFLLLTSLSCGKNANGSVSPLLGGELNGQWKLVKIINGFGQTSVSGDKLPYQETLEFTVNSQITYKRIKDGKQIDESNVSVEKDEVKWPDRLVMNFSSSKTYQVYSIETIDGKPLLNLYQAADIGSVIADGSNYYYEKQ